MTHYSWLRVVVGQQTAQQVRDWSWHPPEADRLLDGKRKLVLQTLIILVRRQVDLRVIMLDETSNLDRSVVQHTLLKHVWLFGSCDGSPDFSIVNRLGPSEPWRSLKPFTGIRDVPVANWRSRDFRSAGHPRIHFQNHCTTWSFISYPR